MFRFDDYVEHWAEVYAPLQHDPSRGSKNKRMYRMDSIMRNEEFAANLANAKSPSVGAVTQFDGTAEGGGARFMVFTHRVFFMVKQATNSATNPVINEVAAAEAKEEGVRMAMKFMAYIEADKKGFPDEKGRPTRQPNRELEGIDIERSDIVTDPMVHNGWWFTELLLQHTQPRNRCIDPHDYLPFRSFTRLMPFRYLAEYDRLDYDFAREYYLAQQEDGDLAPYGCSAVRSGFMVGRNLDWFYSQHATAVVRTPATAGRFAVLGVAGNIDALTERAIADREVDGTTYAILPFQLLDGVNEHGLYCNSNVVPTDKGLTTRSVPAIEMREMLCSRMVPRYVLDHFRTAAEAVAFLRDYCSIYMADAIQRIGYEAHWLICDLTDSFVVEVVNDRVVIHEADVMTNFYLSGFTPNDDGTTCTPADVPDGLLPSVNNGITPHGCGLERWNLIVASKDAADTPSAMRALLNDLFYTHCYQEQAEPWYTEFVGEKGLTVDSDPTAYAPVVEAVKALYKKRDRDIPADQPRTWHTAHSSVYDLATRTLYLVTQEDTASEQVFSMS